MGKQLEALQAANYGFAFFAKYLIGPYVDFAVPVISCSKLINHFAFPMDMASPEATPNNLAAI